MTLKPKPCANALRNITGRLGELEYRPPAALTAYENNPRKHPEKQFVKLMASIREFGFALPVLIDEAGVIIAGHARVEAAKRLALAEVPVIVAAGLDEIARLDPGQPTLFDHLPAAAAGQDFARQPGPFHLAAGDRDETLAAALGHPLLDRRADLDRRGEGVFEPRCRRRGLRRDACRAAQR